MKMRFVTGLSVLLMMCVGVVFAQLPAEVESPSIAGTFAQSGESVTLGVIAGVPIDVINGHAAVFVQRAVEGEETLSETVNAYVQGGVELKGFEFNTFVDLLRNIDRGLQQAQSGYFVQFPKYKVGSWEGAGGVGNVARTREAIAAATGKSGTDLEVAVVEGGQSVSWYAFTNLQHPSGWDLSLKSIPAIDFSSAEVTGTISSSWEIADNFTFDVAYEGIYETERKEFFGSLLGAITYRQ